MRKLTLYDVVEERNNREEKKSDFTIFHSNVNFRCIKLLMKRYGHMHCHMRALNYLFYLYVVRILRVNDIGPIKTESGVDEND